MIRFLAALLTIAAATPAIAGDLCALVDTGELFASEDAGLTWEVRSALPARDAVALAAGDSSEVLYLATAAGSFYTSDDAGHFWTLRSSVPVSDIVAMTVRSDGSILLLARTGSLWESHDGGDTFSPIAALPQSDWVALLSTSSGDLWALTRTGCVARGPDWDIVASLPISDAVGLAAHNGALFILTSKGSLWRSLDQGEEWIPAATLSQVHMCGLLATATGELFAATREGEIAHSENGVDWDWVGTVNQIGVVALASDEASSWAAPTGPDPTDRRILAFGPSILTGSRLRISFEIESAGVEAVQLDLMDVQGRIRHRAGFQWTRGTGRAHLSWSVAVRQTGLYLARLSGSGWSECRRIVIEEP